MPNAEVMIHQVMGGMQGQETDIQIAAEHVTSVRQRTEKMLAEACGKQMQEIHEATERNSWFDADEAIKFGLVDAILS